MFNIYYHIAICFLLGNTKGKGIIIANLSERSKKIVSSVFLIKLEQIFGKKCNQLLLYIGDVSNDTTG